MARTSLRSLVLVSFVAFLSDIVAGDDLLSLVQTDLRTRRIAHPARLSAEIATSAMAADTQQVSLQPTPATEEPRSVAEVASEPGIAASMMEAMVGFLHSSKYEQAPFKIPISPAANKTILAPGYNLTDRLVRANSYLMTSCLEDFASEEKLKQSDCRLASNIVEKLIPISAQPNITVSSPEIQFATQADYWLWFPGPPSAYWQADKDGDGKIQKGEFDTFASNASQLTWKLLDADGLDVVTQGEVVEWVRALSLIRHRVPELDLRHPDGSIQHALAVSGIYTRMNVNDHMFRLSALKTASVLVLFIGGGTLWFAGANYLPEWK